MPNETAASTRRRTGARLSLGLALGAALVWPLEMRAQGGADQGAARAAQPVAQPLSAIDWLNEREAMPLVRRDPRVPQGTPLPAEPPVTRTAVIPDITVTSLAEPGLDAVGLLPASVSGLPLSLWQGSRTADLVNLIGQPRRISLPAMQALFYTLLLAEADAPGDAGRDSRLLQARIDALMQLGAVEPAQALLERAGPEHPALFGRWFDATLMTGAEDTACAALRRAPRLAPSYGARIFCTARGGDWASAVLTLESARALDVLPGAEADLLARFLDPDLFEDMPLPRAPVRPSPLVFRLYEALGEPLTTAQLPRAFAVADLRDTAGWRAQIEAAERLASSGALAPNRLLGIYSERRPAASGGVWDRVTAVQRFDNAMRAGDPKAVAAALPTVWAAMQSADLGVPFASLYSGALMRLPLSGPAADLAYRIALLGPEYETAALEHGARFPERAFVTTLARGAPEGAASPSSLEAAILRGFAAAPPEAVVELLAEGRLGEVILEAVQQIQRSVRGDMSELAGALATLRAVGLEDSARRAALQLALLGQRG